MDNAGRAPMTALALNLLTKVGVAPGSEPLARIWSLDNWTASLKRVRSLRVIAQSADHQLFDLVFDAGGAAPDRIRVERRRREAGIDVRHLEPPPGVAALSGRWELAGRGNVLLAHRSLLLEAGRCDPASIRRTLRVLRENLIDLLGDAACPLPV
jgi:hypothetical protein